MRFLIPMGIKACWNYGEGRRFRETGAKRGDQRKKTTGETTLEVPKGRTFATGCNVMDVLGGWANCAGFRHTVANMRP